MDSFVLDINSMELLFKKYIVGSNPSAKDNIDQINKLDSAERIFLLTQIELQEKAQFKFPPAPSDQAYIIPSRLAVEQASSKVTSEYKLKLIQERYPNSINKLVDMTGGMGVDFMYLSEALASRDDSQAVFIERNQQLLEISKRNIRLKYSHSNSRLNIDFINEDSTKWLERNAEELNTSSTLIYCDPARRGKDGKKLYRIADCQPDIRYIMKLVPRARFLFKLSPILDISKAFQELEMIGEVQVIEYNKEVKELLLICDSGNASSEIVSYVNLDTHISYSFNFSERKIETEFNDAKEGDYLYIPKPGLAKAEAWGLIAKEYSLSMIAPNTKILVSEDLASEMHKYSRVLRIEKLYPFKKNKELAGEGFNIICKNYPASILDIKKKLKIHEGGDRYLVLFGRNDNKPQLAVCHACTDGL